MIRWSDIAAEWSEQRKRRWRRYMCPRATRDAGGCLGYSYGDDDEPCEVCKCCDELGIEVADG